MKNNKQKNRNNERENSISTPNSNGQMNEGERRRNPGGEGGGEVGTKWMCQLREPSGFSSKTSPALVTLESELLLFKVSSARF